MAISLRSLEKSGNKYPPRIVIYGSHKIGKSTFASRAPKAVFVPTEDGLGGIDAVTFPLAKTYQDVKDAINVLLTEDHEHKTCVIDSLDWLERLIHTHVCKNYEKPANNIEDIPYAKGYMLAMDYWKPLLDGLNALRIRKGMGIILIAHAEIKRYDNPISEPYDRYQIKLHKAASALIQEWSDIIGFANYRTFVKQTDVGFDKKITRGIGTGERLLHLAECPAYIAGNRFSLPSEIPLSWPAFANAFNGKKSNDSNNSKEKK